MKFESELKVVSTMDLGHLTPKLKVRQLGSKIKLHSVHKIFFQDKVWLNYNN